jgi:glycosyltransferase involved in cell wall biosynthesis
MSVMANDWARHGRDVTLITLASASIDFYPLHPGIRRISLDLYRPSASFAAAVRNNFLRLKRLRQEIRASRPDVVLSFIDTVNVLTLAASLGLQIPIIASEHTDPRHHKIGSVWAGLRRLLYRQAVAVVVLTDGLRGWAERLVKTDAVHVIPNPVSVSAVEPDRGLDLKHSGGTIAAMGRLGPEKGFDILLKAFAQCAGKHVDWSLIILGEGRERERLETLAAQLGITDRVKMPGRVKDPFRILRSADLFVLSSRYEGFPMALVEAMACKLAVISTDFPSGPRDIVRDGTDAVLVPPEDVDALAAAMDRLMENPEERQRLGTHAGHIVERFSTETIMNMWDELLTSCVAAVEPRH